MSMRENPGSGYVVKLDDLKEAIIKVLPEAEKAKFTEDLDAAIGDPDAVIEALAPCMEGMQLPVPEHVFELGPDDEPDDELERNTWYVLFDESELFVRTPTAELTRLKSLKVEPKLHNWAIFG
jgi:hypothetical protein